jgi:acyl carrier protein
VAAAVCGCTSNTEPGKGKSKQALPDNPEKVVRDVISAQMNVDSSAIQMDKPISDPPINADDLDLVEILMELEDRLGVEISDDAVERYAREKPGKGTARITPNQLMSIIQESPKVKELKRKK